MKYLYIKFLIQRLVSNDSTLIESNKKITLDDSIEMKSRAWISVDIPEATLNDPYVTRDDIQVWGMCLTRPGMMSRIQRKPLTLLEGLKIKNEHLVYLN